VSILIRQTPSAPFRGSINGLPVARPAAACRPRSGLNAVGWRRRTASSARAARSCPRIATTLLLDHATASRGPMPDAASGWGGFESSHQVPTVRNRDGRPKSKLRALETHGGTFPHAPTEGRQRSLIGNVAEQTWPLKSPHQIVARSELFEIEDALLGNRIQSGRRWKALHGAMQYVITSLSGKWLAWRGGGNHIALRCKHNSGSGQNVEV